MKVNDDIIKRNMLEEITLEECPQPFRVVAQNILEMLTRESVGDYNRMDELDRRILVHYWERYDGLVPYLSSLAQFEGWFIKWATQPEIVRRARQWLVEHRFLIIKTDVAVRAQAAGESFRGAIRS